MSFFGSIGKFLGGAVKTVANIGKGVLGLGSPFPVGMGGPMPTSISMMPGVSQVGGNVLPWKLPTTMPGGAPSQNAGGLAGSLGQMAGAMLGFGPAGGRMPGAPGQVRMKRGRLTGNAIPAGYQERMSKQGVIYLGKATRRRGISGRDLSAFRRVSRLLSHYRAPSTFHRRRKT